MAALLAAGAGVDTADDYRWAPLYSEVQAQAVADIAPGMESQMSQKKSGSHVRAAPRAIEWERPGRAAPACAAAAASPASSGLSPTR